MYLGSTELAAACALLGKIPPAEEYLKVVASKIAPFESEVYRYLNFNEIKGFEDEGRVVPKEEEKIEKEAVTAQ